MGSLGPSESEEVETQRIEDGELPLVFGPTGSFVASVTSRTTVEVKNTTDQPVTYALFVVDPRVAHAVTFPWSDLLDALKLPGGPEKLIQSILQKINKRLIS